MDHNLRFIITNIKYIISFSHDVNELKCYLKNGMESIDSDEDFNSGKNL